ncbi:MAG: hypothetical protein PHI27_02550 [Eubacteriales bacterium]|nr:hypothetical protein [Eubacteriales bacterium]MDD3881114.1 hypothetical protein [Eubacteriales bacterium]MDD4511496.1 hypothetical protein [Eubacteriales bacterium]
MKNYTLENVEYLRRAGHMSYDEAIALIEKHGGDLEAAISEIKANADDTAAANAQTETAEEKTESKATEKKNCWDNWCEACEKSSCDWKKNCGFGSKTTNNNGGIFTMLSKNLLMVRKGDTIIANFSLLFSIIATIVAPWLALGCAVLALALGYRISFERKEEVFQNIHSVVHNAARNVRDGIKEMVK